MSLSSRLSDLLTFHFQILYLFNYLDRTNISQARLDTFEEDLGLQNGQFNIAVSVLTAG